MHSHYLEDRPAFDDSFMIAVSEWPTSDLYAASLICQARVNGSTVAAQVRSFPFWRGVQSLLDIGCGPGVVAKNLAQQSLLTDKFYTGIDIETSFIERARQELSGENIQFLCADIAELEQTGFDAILSVAVLQHLGDVREVIPKLVRLVRKEGYLLFFDTYPGARSVWLTPDVPLVTEMFERISSQNTSGKRNDRCLIEFAEQASNFGLQIVAANRCEVPVAPSAAMDYIRFNLLVSELVKRFYSVQIDQKELREQLLFWFSNQGRATIHRFGKLIAQRVS